MDTKKTKIVDDGVSKPCFEITRSFVFLELHNSALEKAAAATGVKVNQSINQFIINTGCSDGSEILNIPDPGQEEWFKWENMEVGIVKELEGVDIVIPNRMRLTSEESDLSEAKKDDDTTFKENLEKIEEAKKKIIEGLVEYFNWFAGVDKKTPLTENDVELFIPIYESEKVTVDSDAKNCVIKSLSNDEIASLLRYYVKEPGKIVDGKVDDKLSNEFLEKIGISAGHDYDIEKIRKQDKSKLRLGFKVSYTIEKIQ